jgi:hypothetical protein
MGYEALIDALAAANLLNCSSKTVSAWLLVGRFLPSKLAIAGSFSPRNWTSGCILG